MLSEQDRPAYHYLPTEGLLWDPCAAIFWRGRYHVFFLHDSWAKDGPSRREDGYEYKSWAHISSSDLVHWKRHANAIKRGQTGNLFVFNGQPVIIFPHPDGGGASCIATNPESDLENWHFNPRATVLRHEVQGHRLYAGDNDVTAWQEGDWCYALTGTRDRINGGDALRLFRTDNLLKQNGSANENVEWHYLNHFYQSNRRWTHVTDDCSCPQLFMMGSEEAKKWMLLHFCHRDPIGSRYYLGRYENNHFYPETFDRINWPGGNIHAPRAMLDGQGRRIMFVNLNEGYANSSDGRMQGKYQVSNWYGVLSLPVSLSLTRDGGAVRFEPVSELKALRSDLHERKDIKIATDSEIKLSEIRGSCLEILLEIQPGSSVDCGIVVRCSPDGSEETIIGFCQEKSVIRIDFSKASVREDIKYKSELTVQSASLSLNGEKLLKLKIFVDRSVLEVFANGQRYLAQRIYPLRPESQEVKVYSRGGTAVVDRVCAWQMGYNSPHMN